MSGTEDRCPTCGVLTQREITRRAIRDANVDPSEYGQTLNRRAVSHANTRAAVDLVSNLGAVMEDVAAEAEELAGYMDRRVHGGDLTAATAKHLVQEIARRLRDALRDDQAERAAFLEHFPHLCNKETQP